MPSTVDWQQAQQEWAREAATDSAWVWTTSHISMAVRKRKSKQKGRGIASNVGAWSGRDTGVPWTRTESCAAAVESKVIAPTKLKPELLSGNSTPGCNPQSLKVELHTHAHSHCS